MFCHSCGTRLLTLGGSLLLDALTGDVPPGMARHAISSAMQLDYFVKVVTSMEFWGGCNDVESLMYPLKTSFERSRRSGALVDVGANRGDVMATMVKVFGEQMFSAGTASCGNVNPWISVYAFEPEPKTFDFLMKRERSISSVNSQRITLVQAAVSNVSGKARLHTSGMGDELATLRNICADEVYKDDLFRCGIVDVDVVTLDEYFGKDTRIHLLKVDAEGFDPLVLQGARKLLQNQLIRFVFFEYSHNWKFAGHGSSLQMVIDELYNLGYICFLVTINALVPLFAEWWQRVYESYAWRNVWCGLKGDHAVFDAYIAYGSNHFTAAFALENLFYLTGVPPNFSRRELHTLRY